MTQYAHYINAQTVQYPQASEFAGIVNWQYHDKQLRKHGYLPLVGEPEERLGVTAKPSAFELRGDYIQVTAWDYIPITAPGPPPLPTRFSKGALLEALRAKNLYDAAKAIYANDLDLQIAFAGFSEIDLEYPATKSIMAQYPELFTEANVQMLREWIRDNE